MPAITQGDVWAIDLDPVRGHEQAGSRPALVISVDGLNRSAADLAIVLPITTVERAAIPTRVRIEPPEGGIRELSFAICEQVRSVSTERFADRWGHVSRATLEQAANYVRLLINT